MLKLRKYWVVAFGDTCLFFSYTEVWERNTEAMVYSLAYIPPFQLIDSLFVVLLYAN